MPLRHQWLIALPALCLFALVAPLAAQDTAPPSTLRPLVPAPPSAVMTPATPLRPDQPLVTPRDAGTRGCLVARDGRVFQGLILDQGEAYRVDTTNGSVVVAHDEVLTIAESLTIAYSQIRDSRPRPGASEHVDLGRWCLQNKLYESASDEARAALRLEPQRQAALDLLAQSDKALGAIPAAVPMATGATSDLPPQAEFVRRIQPLLQNKCSNANCHGAASTAEFKLLPVATGSRPQNIRTAQNLEAVLKQINRDDPDQSPLLVKSHELTGPHAGVLTGPRAREQSERLYAWVRQVAGPGLEVKVTPSAENQARPLMTFRPRDPDESTTPGSVATAPLPKPTEAQSPPSAPSRPSHNSPRLAPLQSPEVMRLLETRAPDPFDPEEFNQLVHGSRTVPRTTP